MPLKFFAQPPLPDDKQAQTVHTMFALVRAITPAIVFSAIVIWFVSPQNALRWSVIIGALGVVFVAGLLLGEQWRLAIGVCCALTGITLGVAQRIGVWQPSSPVPNPEELGLGPVLVIISILTLQHRATSMVKAAFDGIVPLEEQGTIVERKPGTVRLTGTRRAEVVGRRSREIVFSAVKDAPQLCGPLELLEASEKQFLGTKQAPWLGRTSEVQLWRTDGTMRNAQEVSFGIETDKGLMRGGILRDVTERKQAEQALRESEKRYRRLFENAVLGIFQSTPQGKILTVNPAFAKMLGYDSPEQVIEMVSHVATAPYADPSKQAEIVRRIIESGSLVSAENLYKKKNGELFWGNLRAWAVRGEEGNILCLEGFVEDITEHRQRKLEMEAIATVSEALRVASNRAEMLPIIVAQISRLLNTIAAAIGFFDPNTGESVVEYANGDWAHTVGCRMPPETGMPGYVARTRSTYVTDDPFNDPLFYSRDLIGRIRGAACMPLIAQEQVIGWLFAGVMTSLSAESVCGLKAIADIAANAIRRTTLHEQTERHLQRVTALSTIDRAITSNLDLRVTLGVLVDQTISHLSVDAVDILLYKPARQTFEYEAGRGFRTDRFKNAEVRLGDDYAGRAVLERQTIIIEDWRRDIPDPTKVKLLVSGLQSEAFVSYIAVPLIVKGSVNGVLEIFHRSPLALEPEWLDFLHALSEQAAIAINVANLFDDLQQTTSELVLSYDATIAGWSRALDLRDKETEGHSARVTEITLKLAQALGVADTELVHVRRGALLHDIGKMGVPDSILLKSGALTDEEWAVMKQHPVLAYELLSPVHFLRSALDIPYCHHEKWDGTGYPRGLKGEQIPLTARIFAIVDVWDALGSDRPYRRAWTKDKIREYMESEAGKHFDPRVAQVFLGMVFDESA